MLTDGERERERDMDGDILRWKENESTWRAEIEVDALGDGCALKITCSPAPPARVCLSLLTFQA
jgi:hypothetical protein